MHTHCKIEDCRKRAHRRGWCSMHYERLRLSGQLTMMRPHRRSSVETRLKFYGWDVTERGCWEWNGRRNQSGYGVVGNGYTRLMAHRAAYETWVGPIPEGLLIRHHCDNPPCINPAHLEPGTHHDNHLDMMRRDRGPDGERNAMAKLTETDVLQIRELHRAGVPQRAIASIYGVGFPNINLIVHRKTWRHVA